MKILQIERDKNSLKNVTGGRAPKMDVNVYRIVTDYVQGKSINRLSFEHEVGSGHIKNLLEANNIIIRGQKEASSLSARLVG